MHTIIVVDSNQNLSVQRVNDGTSKYTIIDWALQFNLRVPDILKRTGIENTGRKEDTFTHYRYSRLGWLPAYRIHEIHN